MRAKLIAVIVLMVTGGLLCGCVIEPIGYGWHHPYYRDRYLCRVSLETTKLWTIRGTK